jgi:diguanylate cyclase (GGDEF)-like protein
MIIGMFAPKLFVIDDERSILNSVSRILRAAPLALRCFNDPLEALAAAESDPPAAVVSDYRMPSMDGISLLERFKRSNPAATRMLFTGYVDLEAAVGSINRGSVLRFIKKPWDDGEFVSAVLSGLAASVMGRASMALPRFLEGLIPVQSLEEALGSLTRFLGEESGLMLEPPEYADRPSERRTEGGMAFSIPFAPSGHPFLSVRVGAPELAAFEAAGLVPALADLVESALGGLRLASASLDARAGLLELSERDPLTGLYNRRALAARMGKACSDQRRVDRPFSILLIDIDDFKRINDRYGHATGDAVITAVGSAIKDSCREKDFPARFGGDEFIVGLPATGGDGASRLAGRLLARAARAGEELGIESGIGLSIGIAVADEGGFDEGAVIEAADRSMYEVKRSGKNAVGRAEAASRIAPPDAGAEVDPNM